MRNLKLIWDFKGRDGFKTAQHHLVHLKEYAVTHNMDYLDHGVEQVHEMHSIAFVAVPEDQMPQLRDQLKPHRGQLWTEIPEK